MRKLPLKRGSVFGWVLSWGRGIEIEVTANIAVRFQRGTTTHLCCLCTPSQHPLDGKQEGWGRGSSARERGKPFAGFGKMGSSYGILILYTGENNWMFRIKLDKIFYSCNFSKKPLLKRIWKYWRFLFSEVQKKKETQTKTAGKTVKLLGKKIVRNFRLFLGGRGFLFAEIYFLQLYVLKLS